MNGMNVGAGVGTRISVAGDKVSFSAIGRRGLFRGSWFCRKGSEVDITIALGFVNGLEPYVDGRLMSGKDAKGVADPKGVPKLQIQAEGFDKDGRSWVCVSARVDKVTLKLPTLKGLKPDDLKIVQSANRFSDVNSTGLFPVAALRLKPSGEWALRQIAYFDLQHGTRQPEKGRLQHLFWPA